jgi:prophage tail gpP-like protein
MVILPSTLANSGVVGFKEAGSGGLRNKKRRGTTVIEESKSAFNSEQEIQQRVDDQMKRKKARAEKLQATVTNEIMQDPVF